MKTRERKHYLTMVCSALIVFCFACIALAEDQASSPPSTPIFTKKADLIVEKIEIKKVAQDPPYVRVGTPTKVKYQVEITVTVKNKAVGVTAASTAASLTAEGRGMGLGGDFIVAMEWESGGRPVSVEWRVVALAPGASTNMMLGGHTMTAREWVPKGTAKVFRATADQKDWIAESDETNNVKTVTYVAE